MGEGKGEGGERTSLRTMTDNFRTSRSPNKSMKFFIAMQIVTKQQFGAADTEKPGDSEALFLCTYLP